MASVVTRRTDRGTLREIRFNLPGGKYTTIRLGDVSNSVAESFREHVDSLVASREKGRPVDDDTKDWLSELDESILKKLRKAKLTTREGAAAVRLKDGITRVLDKLIIRPETRLVYEGVERDLLKHFGEGTLVSTIDAEGAENWRAWLVNERKLSQATVSRRVKAARMFFKYMNRWKLVKFNPFADLKAGHQSNAARQVFVSREVVAKVLAHCDLEWAVIVSLARYGGLRCPSEILALRWADVDHEKNVLHITSTKTANYEGGSGRVIPLFPELRKPLLDLFADESSNGTDFVVTRNRLPRLNLRTQMRRIIKRAGLEPWERTFHNLRASRQSELMEEFPMASVCRWLGNTTATAAQHYVMPINLDGDFQRAIATGTPEAHNKSAQRMINTSVGSPSNDRQAATAGDNEKQQTSLKTSSVCEIRSEKTGENSLTQNGENRSRRDSNHSAESPGMPGNTQPFGSDSQQAHKKAHNVPIAEDGADGRSVSFGDDDDAAWWASLPVATRRFIRATFEAGADAERAATVRALLAERATAARTSPGKTIGTEAGGRDGKRARGRQNAKSGGRGD